MSSPRIALFAATLGGGGAERVMATLANGFAAQGYNVDMVVMDGSGSYTRDLAPSINVVPLHAKRALRSLFPLAKYLRAARPDLLLVTQAHTNIIAIVARAVARVPSKLWVRETSTPSVIAINARSLRNWVQLALVRGLYVFADEIIAPSQGVKEDLTQRLGFAESRIHVIRNPVAFQLIDERASQEPEHPQFFTDGKPVILGVGRLSEQKDFPTLFRAFAQVRKSRPGRLVILGEGKQREMLEQLAKELGIENDVCMPGFVQNPFAYFRKSSVYVLSSPSEGLPNTLLEALAVGVPVVATDCQSGPREILEDGRWGSLVSVGDVNAMAEAIIAGLEGKLNSPERSHLVRRYAIESILKEYVSLLDNDGRTLRQDNTARSWHQYKHI